MPSFVNRDHRHPGPRSLAPLRSSSNRSSALRLDSPARAVGAVFQGHPELRKPLADLVGQREVLFLAQPSAQVDQQSPSARRSRHDRPAWAAACGRRKRPRIWLSSLSTIIPRLILGELGRRERPRPGRERDWRTG